ncbi:MAG: DUF5686 and carboxypeptidase regulatory-like domain-containing protein [Saprospiraceae bacterium]
MKSILTLLFVSTVGILTAGGIKGYVRDEAGNPLEFATIYINELGSGTVTNLDGYYEFRMLPGDYTVVFQHLGYESQVERVSIGELNKDMNITLRPQVLELSTVEVIDGGEDPAYTVMRKAIAKADFHRQQVDYYKAQVYIKGSGRLLKTPRLVRKTLEKEGVAADSTTAFTSESVSIIEYERPSTFREKVISIYTSGEDQGASPNGFIYGSFYEPEVAQAISPLSTKAFAYYKFELAGFFNDRGYYVNKIKVIPRSKGDDVFSGYIYIVEDLWSIHSLDMDVYKLGIRFQIKQQFAPIQDAVWLPLSHQYLVNGKIFGFGFDYKYLATLSNYEVRINPDLQYDFKVVDEKIHRELAKEMAARKPATSSDMSEWETRLNNGGELTRKDVRQMMREYDKEEKATTDAPEVVSNYTQEIDSLATRRDSAYWSVIRPVPLTKAEVKGYVKIDSLAQVATQAASEAEEGVKNPGKANGGSFFGDLIGGTYFKLGEGKKLHYDGLNNGGFNPVEGYWLSSGLRYTQKGAQNRFELGWQPRYGFSWNRLVWKSHASLRGGDEHSPRRFQVEGGRFVSQYNEPAPVSELFNTFYALLGKRNFVQLYEKKFIGANVKKEWWSNAALTVSVEWAERLTHLNTTDYSIFARDKRTYPENIPQIAEVAGQPVPISEKAATAGFSFLFRPWQQYRIKNGEREALDHSSPAFTLQYRLGLPSINGSVTDFQRLGLVYRHTIKPGARGKIDLKADLGMFLKNDYVGLADFRHFEGNQMIFTTADPVGAFRLLPYYSFSTRDRWLALHGHYQFRKLLFTRIWQVQMTGAKENLFVNYLHTPESQHYTEVGYGIDNIFRFLRLEGIAAFRDGQYYDWGIRIGIASNIFGSFATVNVETGDDD